ncbi:MAG TPA: hypothetical protein VHL79_00850 [Ramlibacter sp.]|jgi:hypothetical protein|nr:hypothetical protein [Ramlibacter sp.]
MTPRRLPLDAQTLRLRPPALLTPRPAAPVGFTRKTFALAMHFGCLGLFGLTVVWPVIGPIASGEVARDLQLLQAVARDLPPLQELARDLPPLQELVAAWLTELPLPLPQPLPR